MNEKISIKKRVLDYMQEHPTETNAKVIAEACECRPHTAYRYAWMIGKKLRMCNSDAPYHGRIHEIKDKAKELLSKFSKNEPLYALELAKKIGCNYITLYSYGREWGYKMHVSRPKKRRTDTVYSRLSEEEKAQRRAARRMKYRMYGR